MAVPYNTIPNNLRLDALPESADLIVGAEYSLTGIVSRIDHLNNCVTLNLSTGSDCQYPFAHEVKVPVRCCSIPDQAKLSPDASGHFIPSIGATCTFHAKLLHKYHRFTGYTATLEVLDPYYPDTYHLTFHTNHQLLTPATR